MTSANGVPTLGDETGVAVGTIAGASWAAAGEGLDMDHSLLLLVLTVAAAAALASLAARQRDRIQRPVTPGGMESPFAVSTEGMKVCPKCGMGNLWTERRCSACGDPLKG
jgi:hypothetical protein